jgi:large conductance mechanosensitive channel
MLAGFRGFISRGNVLDLAVGIVIGAAFTSVVKSFVDDILMPPIGRATGGVDFANLFVTLSGPKTATLEAAKKAGAVTVNYGLFINAVISFLIVAFAVYLIVLAYERMRAREAVAPPEPFEQECPFCRMKVPIAATRCAFCTSDLPAALAAPAGALA